MQLFLVAQDVLSFQVSDLRRGAMSACASLMRGGRFVRSSEIDRWTETTTHQLELGSYDPKPEREDNSVMVLSRGLMAHPLQLANWGIKKMKSSIFDIEIL